MALYEIGMDKGTLWVTRKYGKIEEVEAKRGQAIIDGKVENFNGVLWITGERHEVKDIDSCYRLMGRWYVKPIEEMKASYFVNEEDIDTMNLIRSEYYGDSIFVEKWLLNSWRKSEDVEYAKCGRYVSRGFNQVTIRTSTWIWKEGL